MSEIKTLPFKYYVGALNIGGKGNSYSGSVSLRPQEHNARNPEFKYRIFLEKNSDDELQLAAEYYTGIKSFDNTSEDEIKRELFKADESGLAEAKLCLEKALAEAKEELHNG